jgi:small subunit ribosomal protein S6|tara:strand:- start:243 stop:530 length:288 start_codon:yes stop_codon:yes gene_type:complete
MKKYDLVSILRPTAEDSVVNEIHENITEVITSNGGNVQEQGVWQKRKLAYQIETFNEGIYTITSFEGPANLPNELDRVLKISDDVIRHKVLKMES